jgi:purine nucleoside permease
MATQNLQHHPLRRPVPESQRARARALECRAMAARFRVDFARRQLLRTAATFDRIAEDAAAREIETGVSRLGLLVSKVHWNA